jgi:hypothetical protein
MMLLWERMSAKKGVGGGDLSLVRCIARTLFTLRTREEGRKADFFSLVLHLQTILEQLSKGKEQQVVNIQAMIEEEAKARDLVPTVEAIHDVHQVWLV